MVVIVVLIQQLIRLKVNLVMLVDSMVILVNLVMDLVLLVVDYLKEKVVVEVELLYAENTLRLH